MSELLIQFFNLVSSLNIELDSYIIEYGEKADDSAIRLAITHMRTVEGTDRNDILDILVANVGEL